MTGVKLFTIALLATCSVATAQDVLLTGHVQRIILEPSGAENCPPLCPAMVTALPNGTQRICISNAGGCETMEVKIDHVYFGDADGATRQFTSRIGERGYRFPVTAKQIVISEEAGSVFWSPATERDGRLFIDPKRLPRVAGLPTSSTDGDELVALDEVLARAGANRR